MRRLALGLLLSALAGCSGSPQSLGITGPGAVAQPPAGTDDSTVEAPGLPSGDRYGPAAQPMPSGGRYYNYN